MKGKWKQNSKKKKRNAVLEKYMVAVDEFVKSKSGAEEADNAHGLRFVKKKSRKELRKEKRKLKKAKMKSHYEGKKTPILPLDNGENSGIIADKQRKNKKTAKAKKEKTETQSTKFISAPTETPNKSKAPPSSKKGKKINKLQESRKMALMEANEQEDREIKKLERCLGLNKRKNKKSLPQSFVADGLDYILGVLDSGSSAPGMYDDDEDMDVVKENFEKLEEDDIQSDEDEEPGDEMASEGSGEDMSSLDDEDENDDDLVDEEESEDEEEMEEEVDDSEAADSDNENEEEEADAPHTKTSDLKSESVSLQTLNKHFITVIVLSSCMLYAK